MTIYLPDTAVAERYDIARQSVWRWASSDPSFPKPIKLSPGCSRWRVEDLERWERKKLADGSK